MGITPLSWAVIARKPGSVELLIENGADVNATNQDGATPLHAAAFFGEVDVARILIEKGARTNARNMEGERPIDAAAAPWSDEIQGIALYIGRVLQVEIDIQRMKRGRPKVLEILKAREN